MRYQTTLENRRVDARLGEPRPNIETVIESPKDIEALREVWAKTEAAPVLLMNRDEGTDCSWCDLDIRTLLRGEHSAGRFSAHSLILPPGTGLPPHYLKDVHSYLVVTGGEVMLRIGNCEEQVGEYAMGYAPPNTRMAFRNGSNMPATIIIYQSPAGTERAFAAAHRHWKASGDQDQMAYFDVLAQHGFCFDDAVLSRDALTNTEPEPLDFTVGKDGDIEALRARFERREPVPRLVVTPLTDMSTKATGQNVRKQVMSGDYSGGHAMLTLLGFTAGFGAAPHHQPTEEELFFILKGPLEMVCATESATLTPGGFAFCPRNCTHGFRNRQTEDDTYFMTLNSPAGHERAMATLRQMIRDGASDEDINEVAIQGGFILHEPTLPVNETT